MEYLILIISISFTICFCDKQEKIDQRKEYEIEKSENAVQKKEVKDETQTKKEPKETIKKLNTNQIENKEPKETIKKTIINQTENKEPKEIIDKPNINQTENKESKETIKKPIINQTENKEPKETIKKPIINQKKKKFSFYLIRHAEAMHNYYEKERIILKRIFLRDPVLTNKGKKESSKAGKILYEKEKNIDLIISSPMCRSIESSILMFPEKEIYIMPYLKENSIFGRFSQENQIMDYKEDQITKIQNDLNLFKEELKLNYKYVEDNNYGQKTLFTKEAKDESNLEYFFSYLVRKIQDIIKDYSKKDEIKIAIIGHSKSFKNYFNSQDKLLNNGIIKLEFNLSNNNFMPITRKIEFFSTSEYLIFKGFK
ncbi:MAG: histidine phosphatase family protein [Bacteroidetes bacterium]|nr:histidine phosphatase family protein [Bacteroidota bacterium]